MPVGSQWPALQTVDDLDGYQPADTDGAYDVATNLHKSSWKHAPIESEHGKLHQRGADTISETRSEQCLYVTSQLPLQCHRILIYLLDTSTQASSDCLPQRALCLGRPLRQRPS